jgi:hypothetical protein
MALGERPAADRLSLWQYDEELRVRRVVVDA